MDRDQYNAMKQSGELVTDAALQDAETTIVDDREQDEHDDQNQTDDRNQDQDDQDQDDPDNQNDSDDQDDSDEGNAELTPKEKTAFDKRLERERLKIEEKLRKEIEEQTETKYSKHREAIEHLGGDPDAILKAAQETKLLNEAQRLADQNNWTEEETQWFVQQRKQEQELKELRVQMQINRLKDNPDYAGIASMEKEIMARIDKSNGALNVEEAFWAIGGPKRVEQVKLEQQQREIAKRAQPTRTVQKDSPSSNAGEKPLDPKVLSEAKRMGVSESEARRLTNAPTFDNIDEWREWKKKQAN